LILQKEWASFGPYHKQTGRTLEETLRVYQQNLKEVELGGFTPAPDPVKEEALQKVDETLKSFGGPGLPGEEEKEVKPQSQGNFLDFMMKSIFPDRSNQSSYTPVREDKQIASLQSNKSPSISVVNVTQGTNGGTIGDRSRGAARSSSIPLSNTKNSSPISMMIQNGYLNA
jgi:hypothetical protein